jgi:hypothetical protein
MPHEMCHRRAIRTRGCGSGSTATVLSPEATEPNALIYLAYVAGIVLAMGLLVLGVGLIRGRQTAREG